MKSRNLSMLALALVIGIGAWHTTQRKAPTTELEAAPLYPGLLDRVNEAARLGVSSNDGTVTIVRTGDAWQLEEFDGYPVDVAKVRQALLQLASLEVLETKTRKPEKYADIGVEDRAAPSATSTAVTVVGGDGTPLVDLLLGKTRESRTVNAPGHYVRRAGEATAYLVEGELAVPAKALDWIDTAVVDLSVERVRQVTIQPATGEPIVVAKPRPDVQLYDLVNLPAGREVRAKATVSSIGGLLLDARLERVGKATRVQGAAPSATATVETFDGLTANVRRFEVDGTPWLTFEFVHTPDKAVAPPPAAEPATDAAATMAPEPAPAAPKKPEEVAREVADLNARVQGWAFVLPDYKSRLLDKRLEDVVKKSEPKKPAK